MQKDSNSRMASIKSMLLLMSILAALFHFNYGQLVILMDASNSTITTAREILLKDSSTPFCAELIQLDGGTCSHYSTDGNVLLSGIQHLTQYLKMETTELPHIAIVSKMCITECTILQFISRIYISGMSFSIPVLSLTPTISTANLKVFYMTPPGTVLVDAFFLLCESLQWSRVALVTDNFDPYMTRITEHLLYTAKQRKITISPNIKLEQQYVTSTSHIQQNLKESGTKIILLSTSTSQIADILCAAYTNAMVWPHYGWVVHTLTRSEIRLLSLCSHDKFLEGVIFLIFDLNFTPASETVLVQQAHTDSPQSSTITQLDRLSLDAIRLLTEASVRARKLQVDLVTALIETEYTGITGNITFNESRYAPRDVLFIQVKNHSDLIQAAVKSGKVLLNRWTHEGELPIGDLPVRLNVEISVWLGVLEITVCTILITTVLILYVYYRKEPEVRATSLPLSLIMLLGCYMLVIYLTTLIIHSSFPPIPYFDCCIFIVWMSGVGLPYPLILAVLLVKMLRVYYIFHYYGKLGKMSSDPAMVIFILLILSPSIVVLVVMTALKANRWSYTSTVQSSYIEIRYVCMGELGSYYIALTCYIILLILCVTFVAFKTRKLRIRHFRDAKKINAFLFLFVLVGLSGLILYKVSKDRDLYLQAGIILHVTHCFLIFFCLAFLFSPKLCPLIHSNYFKRKNFLYSDFRQQLLTPILNHSS